MSLLRVMAPRLMATLLVAIVAVAGPVDAQNDAGVDAPVVVVTTEVLGAIVSDLVGSAADVTVLMPHGTDPHSWQPSARDTETIFAADYVVANGLDLEQGLLEILDQATAEGVRVFRATDHITVRASVEPGHSEGDLHDHAVGDPHFWLDPLAMRDMVLALGPALGEAGIDVATRTAELAVELETLDTELAAILSTVPESERKLVTGHESLGYFADRYGFSVVATVIPGQSTSVEPSARDLVDLIAAVRSEGVKAVFTEVATPQSVARAVADEAGAQVVELDVAQLPDGASYADFMRGIAQTITSALSS
jgi:zinc/manganese transport system substrate-binding protein